MTGPTLRVASWNIERGYFPDQSCHFLRSLNADIYLLTELDRGNKRTAGVDMFDRIQQSLDMPGLFALEFIEHDSIWRSIIRQGGPGGGTHGNAIFSKHPIQNYRALHLPTNKSLPWNGSTIIPELFEPRSGQRNAQAFEIELGPDKVLLINTHLENWRNDWTHRKEQLEYALSPWNKDAERETETEAEREKERATHCIIAGDFNPIGGVTKTIGGRSKVNHEVIQLREYLASRGLYDPFSNEDYTIFSFGTRSKFDWLAASEGLTVTSKANLRTPLSDHNCLVVDFIVPKASEKTV